MDGNDRRCGGAPFGLAIVIAGASHLVRLGRAGFVFAREGVFALIDITRLPLPARAAVRVARLIERPTSRVAANRLATALTRLGPSYVKLGQFLATRPDVVGVDLPEDGSADTLVVRARNPRRFFEEFGRLVLSESLDVTRLEPLDESAHAVLGYLLGGSGKT